MGRYKFFFFLLLFIAGAAQAQTQPDSTRSYFLSKTQESIKIDGVLNEAIWQKAEKANNFWQQYPYDTALATTKTEVMMTYDQHNIYVGHYNFDKIN